VVQCQFLAPFTLTIYVSSNNCILKTSKLIWQKQIMVFSVQIESSNSHSYHLPLFRAFQSLYSRGYLKIPVLVLLHKDVWNCNVLECCNGPATQSHASKLGAVVL